MPAVPSSPNSPIPPELALVRLRVPGFANLSESERVQAAALALRRDFGIAADGLLLATLPGEREDVARVAYCREREAPSRHRASADNALSTTLLAAMQPGHVYWVGAPAGYVISAEGAIVVEDAAVATATDQASAASVALPRAVQMSLTSAAGATPQLVLVDHDSQRIDAALTAMWSAGSGAEIVTGKLPAAAPVALRAVPAPRFIAPATAIDRSLRWLAAAAIACAVLAGVRLALAGSGASSAATTNASATATATRANGAAIDSQAGALFERIATVAPDLLPQLQSGSYASGAWVLQLPAAVDADSIKRMARSLEVNGLAVQSTQQPAPRLRIQLAAVAR